MATTAKIAKDERKPEVRMPAPQPLLALRTAARLFAQVRICRLFPATRANGEIPGRDQGELVAKGFTEES